MKTSRTFILYNVQTCSHPWVTLSWFCSYRSWKWAINIRSLKTSTVFIIWHQLPKMLTKLSIWIPLCQDANGNCCICLLKVSLVLMHWVLLAYTNMNRWTNWHKNFEKTKTDIFRSPQTNLLKQNKAWNYIWKQLGISYSYPKNSRVSLLFCSSKIISYIYLPSETLSSCYHAMYKPSYK